MPCSRATVCYTNLSASRAPLPGSLRPRRRMAPSVQHAVSSLVQALHIGYNDASQGRDIHPSIYIRCDRIVKTPCPKRRSH